MVINISPFDQITVSEIVEIFASVITNEVDFLYEQKREGWKGDVPEYLFDTSEAQQMGTLAVQSSRVAVERSLRENLALL
jgi:UDP-glucose 4-epimerase